MNVLHISHLLTLGGVITAEFDKDALKLGKLKAEQLYVRFADGTLIDTERVDLLPSAIELDAALATDVQSATLLLALPLEHANGSNCILEDTVADRPIRYRQTWQTVQDIFSDGVESVAIMHYALSLRFEEDDNSDYLTCAVARIVRDMQGRWIIDPQFVPPLLQFNGHSLLTNYLDRLLIQLRAKRMRLMGMRRESNQRMADFAVADVSLFWLLNALNSYEPVLNDFFEHPVLHPEIIYRELVKLAGALLTFSLEHDMDAIPVYDHSQLGTVFSTLFDLISSLLEASLPSRVISLELIKGQMNNQWQVTLNDPRLREDADLYLSVRSSLPAHVLQIQLPQLCKIGAPDDVNKLINVALSGIPLIPLNHVPAAIPLRLENIYFALDLNHPSAKAMLAAGVCAFYLPNTLSSVQLELYAVLRS